MLGRTSLISFISVPNAPDILSPIIFEICCWVMSVAVWSDCCGTLARDRAMVV